MICQSSIGLRLLPNVTSIQLFVSLPQERLRLPRFTKRCHNQGLSRPSRNPSRQKQSYVPSFTSAGDEHPFTAGARSDSAGIQFSYLISLLPHFGQGCSRGTIRRPCPITPAIFVSTNRLSAIKIPYTLASEWTVLPVSASRFQSIFPRFFAQLGRKPRDNCLQSQGYSCWIPCNGVNTLTISTSLFLGTIVVVHEME